MGDGVNELLVVLGHRAPEIAAVLGDVRTLTNADYHLGMLASIQCGCRAADPQADWFLIALGDQPSLRTDTLDTLLLIAESAAPETAVIIPTHEGRRGHPLLLRSELRSEIAGLEPDGGMRSLVRRDPGRVRLVEVADAGVPADMDTPEDYLNELRRRGLPLIALPEA